MITLQAVASPQGAAIVQARALCATGRVHVVRHDYQWGYFVCPLYETGAEGYRADMGYAGMGVIAWMPEHLQSGPR